MRKKVGFESLISYNGKNKNSIIEQYGTLQIRGIFFTLILPEYNLMNYKKSVYDTERSFLTDELYISHIDNLVIDTYKLDNIKQDNIFILKEKKDVYYVQKKLI